MRIITTTQELSAFCIQAREHPYVTIDTEFLRERSYYAKLCLVQLASPPHDTGPAVLVDPLAKGISLDPLFALLSDETVIKVFHAARQDLEIFYIDGGVIPSPLFDTQVAAMVCGFGDQVGYETLVRKIANGTLDKSSRFTDWSRRPLTAAQQGYALADVTHLRAIYEYLQAEMVKSNRLSWMTEELAILTTAETYVTSPKDAWQRIKTRNSSPKFLGLVQSLAMFREEYAQENNIPRARVFKDEALLELAAIKPRTIEDLSRARLLLRDARRGPIAQGILTAVETGLAADPQQIKRPKDPKNGLQINPALVDLLRVLLKAKCDEHNVAQKLVASSNDLDFIAGGIRDIPALRGWRAKVFGNDALRLCAGEIGLRVQGNKVIVSELE